VRARARAIAAAGAAVVAASLLTATPASAAEGDGCFLGSVGQWLHLPGCGESGGPVPSPTPSGSSSGLPAIPVVPGLPVDPAAPVPAPSATPTAPPAATRDDGAPVFTADPPVLSGSAIGLEGLRDIRIVEVAHADGSTARVLRISADRVVVEGFHLDVPSGEGGLANDDERMIASGNVVVYADSLTGILATGAEVVVDTLSEPPSVESLRELTRIHLPLVGMTADSVVHVGSHQRIHEGAKP
jgi:hypothetical protein